MRRVLFSIDGVLNVSRNHTLYSLFQVWTRPLSLTRRWWYVISVRGLARRDRLSDFLPTEVA